MHQHQTELSSAQDFYDRLAERYDDMVGFAARVTTETEALRPLTEEFSIRNAVDMGCGTGVHTIGLSSLGVDVTGIDVSPEMLARACAHAEGRKGIRFIEGDFLSAALKQLHAPDAIFCLGNTLPHIASITELARILAYWKSCLRPGGRIIVQLLNYERILRQRERIIGIRRGGDAIIIRFYDFTEPRITFNILTILEKEGRMSHGLQSTLLTPFNADNLRSAALDAGFRDFACHASLQRDSYGSDAKDLVAVIA
jgi:glycine/sarcosine N-methyltransferase